MLNGFEEQTKPLDEYEEKTLLPLVILGLSNKVGKGKAVKNNYICKMLKTQGYKIDGARLRKLINHIRIRNMVIGLIATSDGYYIAESRSEMGKYLQSLRGRENAIKAVRVAIENQMEVMY